MGMPETTPGTRKSGKLDTRIPFATPEGVALTLNPAGPAARIHAYLIDFAIRGAVLAVAGIVMGLMGHVGTALLMVIYFLLEWFYPVVFEVLWQGQTPGKRRCQLRVLNTDATPVGFSASLVRNLLRAVDILPLLYMGGLVCMVVNRRFQRLGDLAAGTMVTRDPQHKAPAIDPDAGVWVPALPLQVGEQQAIIQFAERCPELSFERQQELAEILAPLTGEQGPRAVSRLKALANGLTGRTS